VVICLERGADLHMAQLMPLPLTVSCLSEIQIGFTFLVPAHPGSPRNRAVKRARARVCVIVTHVVRYSFDASRECGKIDSVVPKTCVVRLSYDFARLATDC